MKIFVSSTSRDLAGYRSAVARELKTMPGIDVVHDDSWTQVANWSETLRRLVEDCDLLVILVGLVRGGNPPGEMRSYTQLEYETARRAGIPVLAFITPDDFETDPKVLRAERESGTQARQGVFRDEIKAECGDGQASAFVSESKLATTVLAAVAAHICEHTTRTRRRVVRTDTTTAAIQELDSRRPRRMFDREQQRRRLVSHLNGECTRTSVVVGKSGMGKTALCVASIGDFLEQQRAANQPSPHLLFLSPTSPGSCRLNLPNLLAGLTHIASVASNRPLPGELDDPATSDERKIDLALDCISPDVLVVVIDNLESRLDPTTLCFVDQRLESALEYIADTGGHSVRMVFTTQAVPNAKATSVFRSTESLVELREGLPTEDACDLLRSLESKDSYNLRLATAEDLASVVALTGGMPSALLHAQSLLNDFSVEGLQELVASGGEGRAHIEDALADALYGTLSAPEQQVMMALSVFHTKVPTRAIEFLLDSPTEEIRDALRGLVRRLLLERGPNGDWGLHTIDRRCAARKLTTTVDSDVMGQRALRERAVEYFRSQRRAREEWQSFMDLEPVLGEFALLLDLGRIEEATELLLEIDDEFLRPWGHASHAIELHDQANALLPVGLLRARSYRAQGSGHLELGEYAKAAERLSRARADYETLGETMSLARCTAELGDAEFYQNRIQTARELESKALLACCDGGTPTAEAFLVQAKARTRIATCGIWTGSIRESLRLAEDLLREARGWKVASTELQRQLNFAQGIYGLILHYLGEPNAAQAQLLLALQNATTFRYSLGESLHLANLAEFHLDYQRFEIAKSNADRSIMIAELAGLGLMRHWARTARALAGLASDGPDENVLEDAREACEHDVPLNNANAWAIRGLCELRSANKTEARFAFQRASEHAELALQETPTAWNDLQARFLANSGLALLGDATLAAAKADLETTSAIAATPGYKLRRDLLLSQLRLCDPHSALQVIYASSGHS